MPAKVNIVARTGNEAMAEAMRQINPDVVAAYPITPAKKLKKHVSQKVVIIRRRLIHLLISSDGSTMRSTPREVVRASASCIAVR